MTGFWTEFKKERAEMFSQSRAGAQAFYPDLSKGRRYNGTLGGTMVALDTHPKDGFKLKAEAVKAAQEFKAYCKKVLSEHSPDVPQQPNLKDKK